MSDTNPIDALKALEAEALAAVAAAPDADALEEARITYLGRSEGRRDQGRDRRDDVHVRIEAPRRETLRVRAAWPAGIDQGTPTAALRRPASAVAQSIV